MVASITLTVRAEHERSIRAVLVYLQLFFHTLLDRNSISNINRGIASTLAPIFIEVFGKHVPVYVISHETRSDCGSASAATICHFNRIGGEIVDVTPRITIVRNVVFDGNDVEIKTHVPPPTSLPTGSRYRQIEVCSNNCTFPTSEQVRADISCYDIVAAIEEFNSCLPEELQSLSPISIVRPVIDEVLLHLSRNDIRKASMLLGIAPGFNGFAPSTASETAPEF